MDWFTRYNKVYSLRHATVEEMAQCVLDFITTFGVPLELYGDNARNLNGEVIYSLIVQVVGSDKTVYYAIPPKH